MVKSKKEQLLQGILYAIQAGSPDVEVILTNEFAKMLGYTTNQVTIQNFTCPELEAITNVSNGNRVNWVRTFRDNYPGEKPMLRVIMEECKRRYP